MAIVLLFWLGLFLGILYVIVRGREMKREETVVRKVGCTMPLSQNFQKALEQRRQVGEREKERKSKQVEVSPPLYPLRHLINHKGAKMNKKIGCFYFCYLLLSMGWWWLRTAWVMKVCSTVVCSVRSRHQQYQLTKINITSHWSPQVSKMVKDYNAHAIFWNGIVHICSFLCMDIFISYVYNEVTSA